jgi:RNA polymerase sigma-70 factor (ECF subfamily)
MQDINLEIAALRPFLVRVARKHLRNDAWVEDAVSETLVAALERPAAFAGKAMVRTWLVGILKNKMVDQIRRHSRECQFEYLDDESAPGPAADALPYGAGEQQAHWGDPLESMNQRQFMVEFNRCLKSLPPQQGRAFMLRNCMDRDTDDICSELGVNANHLGVLLHRARNRLRESLQAQWAPFGRHAPLQPQA